MFDCWKNSCHGATVVPTMAMTRSTDVESNPPCTPGTRRPWKNDDAGGWLCTARGMTRRLAKTNTNMKRSHRRKLPVAVITTRATAAMGTEMYSLTPKYPRARLTPMNSVAMVRKFRMKRSPTEKAPQNLPKRSLMSRACPTPVTAPRRTTISWFTMSTGMSRGSVHSRVNP